MNTKPAKAANRILPARAGINLLEVLISMFVLTIGLLGLASMIPVGQVQVQQATHADLATALGRGKAFRLIKVMDMLDEEAWVTVNSGTYQDYTPTPPYPFVIDGLGLANNVGVAAFERFPYVGATFGSSTIRTLDRVSLKDLAIGNPNIAIETADRIFRGTDDMLFELPSDTTQRPIIVNATASPQAQSAGDYSWMVMVSPAVWYDTTAPGPAVPQFIDGLGTTTVIVFHKRDPTNLATPESERAVWADVLAAGGNVLDVRLRDASSTSLTDAKNVLKVKPNQWVMISGEIDTTNTDPDNIPVHRWFRIAAVGEVGLLNPANAHDTTTNPYVSEVTLAGPDINYFDTSGVPQYTDADNDNATPHAGGNQTLVCTICDGVVGVYEKTVQLDEPSLWTGH